VQENLLIITVFLLGVAVGGLFEKLVQALFGTKEVTPFASHNNRMVSATHTAPTAIKCKCGGEMGLYMSKRCYMCEECGATSPY